VHARPYSSTASLPFGIAVQCIGVGRRAHNNNNNNNNCILNRRRRRTVLPRSTPRSTTTTTTASYTCTYTMRAMCCGVLRRRGRPKNRIPNAASGRSITRHDRNTLGYARNAYNVVPVNPTGLPSTLFIVFGFSSRVAGVASSFVLCSYRARRPVPKSRFVFEFLWPFVLLLLVLPGMVTNQALYTTTCE